MTPLSPDDLLPKTPPESRSWWLTHRAPLKRNALATLRAPLPGMGFATAPVKTQKESFAVRVVWVYPSDRAEQPYTCYEPVGLVHIPVAAGSVASRWQFHFASHGRYVPVFRQFFAADSVADPRSMFSSVGISEIDTAVAAKQQGGHYRTMQQKRRLRIIAELPELWDHPDRIVCLLRDCGLYSEKTPMDQQTYSVESHIQRLRAAKA
jgi:hypothetical protein